MLTQSQLELIKIL